MMYLAVVGSRTFNSYKLLKQILDEYRETNKEITIVSGGAPGADTLAETYAQLRKIPVIIYKADWKKYGKQAGFLRNKKIVDKCDSLVAFWDGRSKGTKHSIDLANKQGKLVSTILFDSYSSFL